ncbi:MAG: histidine kinase [Anaerolineae bacterium]|nr:histidine kinase [Anaerolineae bacterium]
MIEQLYGIQGKAMTKQKTSVPKRIIVRILTEIVLPAIAFSVGVNFAIGNYRVSFITGLAISGTIYILYELDQIFLHPRLERLPRDWQLGLEIAFGLLEHVLGALLALLACGRIFDFVIEHTTAWMVVWMLFVGFLAVHSAMYALRFYRELKEKELLEERLRALAAQAELRALKAQINPHFLFNTLNTIAQLIHADPAQAEATVERLAEMFRYVLAGSERGLTPLEEELSFLDDYLKIEQARFGERLRVTREITPEALSIPVPSLILQPLVENAVRHGRGDDGSVALSIYVRLAKDEVTIAIADQGPGMPPHHKMGKGPGYGLRNVDERLRKAYGHGLEIRSNEPQGTVVTVRIPV